MGSDVCSYELVSKAELLREAASRRRNRRNPGSPEKALTIDGKSVGKGKRLNVGGAGIIKKKKKTTTKTKK